MRILVKKSSFKNSSFVNDISTKPSNLEEKFSDFLSKYDNVNSVLQQCEKFDSHLLTRIIQLQCNAVPNSQYSRRETIELNPVPPDIIEDILEENICKALSLTGVNIVPNDLHACRCMKRSDRVIVKFKCRKRKHSVSYKC